MTGSAEDWTAANNAYLAASLRWLRLRLAAAVPPPVAPAPSPVVALSPKGPLAPKPRWSWGMPGGARTTMARQPRRPVEPRLHLPVAPLPGPDPAEIERAAFERAERAAGDPAPALVLLQQRVGLSDFERDVVLLCAAGEFDPGIAGLIGGGSARDAAPTFALALQVLPDPTWEALSPHRPLRFAQLIEVTRSGATPLTASALRCDERVVNYIKGLNVPDERVAALAPPVEGTAPPLAASQQAVAEAILRDLRLAADAERVPIVQLVGADAASKEGVARTVAGLLGRRLHRLRLDPLAGTPAEEERFARLWCREAVLLPVALVIDATDVEPGAEKAALLDRLLGHGLGLVFVDVREPVAHAREGLVTAEVRRPTPREQHAAWTATLEPIGEGRARLAAELAGQFDLGLDEIARVASALPEPKGEAAESARGTLWAAARELTRPQLSQLAERIDVKAGWDDLMVPPDIAGLLRQIVGQVRGRYTVHEEWGFARTLSRGLGVTALFAGESGTGKTMAAEVLAAELQLHLYRIDLSAVVSKYIGETEKNLRRLFDAAERGGAILLFDEADALFGKRSEVKDSHDRYANIEINYLLQRMEAFSGLAILASNMKSALDPAFMRRLRFVITLPFPTAEDRKRMWRRALSGGAPTDEIDYDRLARFGLSGGNIISIALNAAFLASSRGQRLTTGTLLAATRTELRKLDKPVNEAEFR